MEGFQDENEIIINGIKYIAVEESNGCEGCVFDNDEDFCADFESLHCTAKKRKDKRNVIFQIKYNMEYVKMIDENHIEIDGVIYEKKGTKQEKGLLKTWKEFCENNPIKEGEVYISDRSCIIEYSSRDRGVLCDKNSLPSKELAEAMLALCQLIQLRDCYNQGWKHDWTKKDNKYCITISREKACKDVFWNFNKILYFKTEKLRDEFYNNFKDLIEVAKQLL